MIFVTGGTGILGMQLLFDLTQQGSTVTALFRSSKKKEIVQRFFNTINPSNSSEQFNKINWVQGDLLDIPSLEEAMKGATHVYHCAAFVSFHTRDYYQLMKINREGTENIVNVSLGIEVEKLCHVSSTAAIGGDSKSITTEETKWKQEPTTSGYSISKYSAEKEVWRGIEEGLNAVIVNPSVILGAGNWNESSLTIFRTLEKGTRFYPPGKNATVDARDVSSIMIQLMNSSITKERFLCIGSNQSFQELMSKIAKQLATTPPKTPVKKWTVHIARFLLIIKSVFTGKRSSITKETIHSLYSERVYSNEKICSTLDYSFRTLEDTIDYSIKHRLSD